MENGIEILDGDREWEDTIRDERVERKVSKI